MVFQFHLGVLFLKTEIWSINRSSAKGKFLMTLISTSYHYVSFQFGTEQFHSACPSQHKPVQKAAEEHVFRHTFEKKILKKFKIQKH